MKAKNQYISSNYSYFGDGFLVSCARQPRQRVLLAPVENTPVENTPVAVENTPEVVETKPTETKPTDRRDSIQK
jgi:hypothetical protein